MKSFALVIINKISSIKNLVYWWYFYTMADKEAFQDYQSLDKDFVARILEGMKAGIF